MISYHLWHRHNLYDYQLQIKLMVYIVKVEVHCHREMSTIKLRQNRTGHAPVCDAKHRSISSFPHCFHGYHLLFLADKILLLQISGFTFLKKVEFRFSLLVLLFCSVFVFEWNLIFCLRWGSPVAAVVTEENIKSVQRLDFIHLVQDTDQWQAVLKTVMNIQVP